MVGGYIWRVHSDAEDMHVYTNSSRFLPALDAHFIYQLPLLTSSLPSRILRKLDA